jgi:hypothetical protein
MTLFLIVSNFELSKHLSVFVPLWLNNYNKLSIFKIRFHDQFFLIQNSMLGVRPARNALKLVRGKSNNLIHNSMIMLTQRIMHGRRMFDVRPFSVHPFSVNLPPVSPSPSYSAFHLPNSTFRTSPSPSYSAFRIPPSDFFPLSSLYAPCALLSALPFPIFSPGILSRRSFVSLCEDGSPTLSDDDGSHFRILSSVFCLPSSVIRLLSSVFRPLSSFICLHAMLHALCSLLHTLCSLLYHSAFRIPPSDFFPLSSPYAPCALLSAFLFHLPNKIYRSLNGFFHHFFQFVSNG